jgi:EmrB/QacA subfamily drug resistance transporter
MRGMTRAILPARPVACNRGGARARPARDDAPRAERRGGQAVTRSERWTLAVVCAATAVLLLDVTVVNVALPAIEADLGATFSELQWVVDAYALTLAGVLLAVGALADRLGRRRAFVAGLGLFTLASLACAAAPSAPALDVARGVQGVGAAAMFATSLALLADTFSPARRGRALGIWGATSGAAIAAGPLVGGALVDALGWEAIFLLNLPIGLALGWAALARVPESRDPAAPPPDWVGAVAFTLAAFLAILALIRGNAEGWGSTPIVGALVASGLLLAGFVWWELRARNPMLDPRLFRIPAFTGTAVVAFAQSVAIYPMFLFLAIYFQELLGYGPFDTGLRVLPITLALFALAPISGRLTGRVSLRALLVAGLVLVGAGLLLMRGVTVESDWTRLVAGFVVGGAGIGVISPALAAAMVGVLPVERAGLASGINNTFRQVGIAAGIAGLGAIFQRSIERSVEAAAGRGPGGEELARAAAEGRLEEAVGGLAAPTAERVARAAEVGFVGGLNDIFLVAALVAFAGAAIGALLLRPRDFRVEAAVAPAPGGAAAGR